MRFIEIVGLSLICVLFATTVARSETAAPDPNASALMARLSAPSLREIQRMPEVFLENAAALIVGYGTAKGISPKGIETSILHQRSRARARAVRDLSEIDLDADGQIAPTEIKAVAPTLSAWARGRLHLRSRAADLDQDGHVSAAELASYADARSIRAFSDTKAQTRRDLMAFDHDQNGWVTLGEVIAGVRALGGEQSL